MQVILVLFSLDIELAADAGLPTTFLQVFMIRGTKLLNLADPET